MEPLADRLLGSSEAMVGQQPLSFPIRSVLAPTVHLVVEGGRPGRETMVALL